MGIIEGKYEILGFISGMQQFLSWRSCVKSKKGIPDKSCPFCQIIIDALNHKKMTDTTILFVDDEVAYQKAFIRAMRSEKQFSLITASGGMEALGIVRSLPVDIVITDMKMPTMNGLELLEKLRELHPDIFVIVITGYGTIEDAVAAIKNGAYDYLLKPLDFNIIKMLLNKLVQHRQVVKASINQPMEVNKQYQFNNIIGQDRKMFKIYEMINSVAKTNASILITGESGSGKELIAEAIHDCSNRKGKPFHQINCAALTESIINSELFGYEKGAFTGADKQKIGFFELANEGTLFLDEIGDIPIQTQVSLLRVLELGTFQRVGGTNTISVDTRIICATNQNITEALREKRFREDLYYRINVVSIDVPPLRERKQDLPILGAYFLEKYSQENNKDIHRLSKKTVELFQQYDWPGNVRELANVIKHAVIFCKGKKIQPENLPEHIRKSSSEKKFQLTLQSPSLPLAETALIQTVLEQNKWNLKQAASDLNIARGTLYSKMKKYGLQKNDP